MQGGLYYKRGVKGPPRTKASVVGQKTVSVLTRRLGHEKMLPPAFISCRGGSDMIEHRKSKAQSSGGRKLEPPTKSISAQFEGTVRAECVCLNNCGYVHPRKELIQGRFGKYIYCPLTCPGWKEARRASQNMFRLGAFHDMNTFSAAVRLRLLA